MGLFAVILVCLIPPAVLALWVGSLKDEKYRDALYKLHLLRSGFAHMLFSTDKKFPKKHPSPHNLTVEESKTIIFVRHAESAWNLVFNKGFGADFPGRLGSALKLEGELFPSMDSVFVDSPLSAFGTSQGESLQKYVNSDMTEEVIGGRSLIVSSNLRRALSTATIGFWHRLRTTGEKIKILSCLQEVTFNMDGVSLAKPYTAPQLSKVELQALGYKTPEEVKRFSPDELFECSENKGNKAIKSCGYDRLVEYCNWCFEEPQEEYDTIITVGHSLYFRYFFRHFLDAGPDHVARKHKMANCAVVKFELQKGVTKDGEPWFRIPEESMVELDVGFEVPKTKKKQKSE